MKDSTAAPLDSSSVWHQICHASASFSRSQRLLSQLNGSHTHSHSHTNSHADIKERHQKQSEQILLHAKESLSIYKSVYSKVKKCKNQNNARDNKCEQRTINLELRMAALLRFMARVCVCVASDTCAGESVREAIRYHDEAVSLLVGVFDADDADDEPVSGEMPQPRPGAADPPDADESADGESPLLLTFPSNPHVEGAPRETPIQLSFLDPTENQRVRAISSSLNALASLHASLDDSRSAMDSYREALEILKAATEECSFEEEEEKEEERIETDLASTLMNVGNFHLRRDELEAAMNAYSTVFALCTGQESEREDGGGGSTKDKTMVLVPRLNSPRQGVGQIYSLQALSALNNLGIVHERRGELSKACECYHQVRFGRMRLLGETSLEVADAWVNIGNCLQRKLEWDEAEAAYFEAEEICRQRIRDEGEVGTAVRIRRTLSGTLRNNATCCWKQRRIGDAIDQFREAVSIEETIVSALSSGEGVASMGGRNDIHQAKLSMAQVLGILGCLYLEHSSAELRSFRKSKASFQRAVQIYFELGYDASHPSIVWAGNNLESVGVMEEKSKMAPPPPPPPTPPPKKRGGTPFASRSAEAKPDVVHRACSAGKEEGDSVFLGVDDYQSSTDELDEILSERIENVTKSAEKVKLLDHIDASPFDEEADFDSGFIEPEMQNTEVKETIGDVNSGPGISKPLLPEHRNTSYTSFGDDVEQDAGAEREDEFRLREELNMSSEHFGDESAEAAQAHVALANQFWQRGDRASATEHYTIAHSIYESKLGDNTSCAIVLKALGDLNKEDEKLEAAKELYQEAMEIETSVHGHCLPHTLNAAGVMCLLEDDHRSAMEFHRRALQLQQKSLNEDNKYDMYETLVLIGNVYYSERNNLTNIRQKGVDYKEFIESGFLGWIANAHDMRGEYTKACQFYEESLQISISKKRKESKKETALTLNRLGSLNRELGRYEEAIDYHQRAMLLQQSHSTNSAKAMTAETCVLMGMTKAKMGDFKTALDLYEDSLLVLKAALGDRHLSVSKTMTQIGNVHFELSNYDLAMNILTEAEDLQMSTVGPNHRDTFETESLIGRVLSAIGKYDLALVKLHGVAEKQVQMFGENHPAIAETNHLIGECFLNQGMAAEARAMFLECYNMRKLFFSMDQLVIAESMVDIIRARAGGRPERSLAIYSNAMEVYREYLSDHHVQIGHLLVYEGDVHAELLDFSTAVDRYHKAGSIFLRAFGEGHIVEGDILVKIGQVLLRKCDYDGAKEQFCTALDIYNAKLPEGHPKIAAAAQHLDRVEQEEALCV